MSRADRPHRAAKAGTVRSVSITYEAHAETLQPTVSFFFGGGGGGEKKKKNLGGDPGRTRARGTSRSPPPSGAQRRTSRPSAGPPAKFVRCSTTGISACSSSVWAGRVPSVMSSTLAASIRPGDALLDQPFGTGPGEEGRSTTYSGVPNRSLSPVSMSTARPRTSYAANVSGPTPPAGASRSRTTTPAGRPALERSNPARSKPSAKRWMRGVDVRAGVRDHRDPSDLERGAFGIDLFGGLTGKVRRDLGAWEPWQASPSRPGSGG